MMRATKTFERMNSTRAISSRNAVLCMNRGPICEYSLAPLRRAMRIWAPMLNPKPSMKIIG